VEIVRYATAKGVDLIVIGTHGYHGIGSVLLGSVAEKVVHHAPCPVLAIRPTEVTLKPETGLPKPAISEKELSQSLAQLLTKCTDSGKEWRRAAADVTHEGLKVLFAGRAEQCDRFAEELQVHAISHGKFPKPAGSLAGVLHRDWLHIKALLGSDRAIIRSSIQEVLRLEQAYENVLRHAIPEDVRRVLQRHLLQIRLTARSLEGLEVP
jgi:uncharacterized protein (TIGR02284 family)